MPSPTARRPRSLLTKLSRLRPSRCMSRICSMTGAPTTELTYYPCLFLSSSLRSGCVISEPALRDFTHRHKIELKAPDGRRFDDPLLQLRRSAAAGVVFFMSAGLPDLEQFRVAEQALSTRRRVWF